MKKFFGHPFAAQVTIVCLFLGVGLTRNSAQAQFSLDREPAGPSSRKTGLAITEIMYNPRAVPGEATNRTLEFVELFNSKPWSEDIGGFSIDGSVHYTFASNTILKAGGYLAVARVPELVITNYSVTNVFGPWDGATTNRLGLDGGTVMLRNRQGAILLTVNYADSPPWPESADGTGHSLSLMRPSYGEDDYRAWSESDRVGGSPGAAEPRTLDPLANVVINEWQNHSDPFDWIELYNHSNAEVDLSGAWLSDDPLTNKFRIPNGTKIPPHGFLTWDQNQLGFELFAGGETIFLWNSNQTRVIDVIDFRGSSNNVSQGRWPDGGPNIYGIAANSASRGQSNPRPVRYGVVINEIMYNPISGNTDEEYVEIYNRGNQSVSVAGWEFIVGINYVFPTNPITLSMPPGAYWIVARNPTNLFAIYSNLNTNNTFGPYSGTLANGGERITLAAADYDMVQNGGITTIEKLQVPVSDFTYGDGGQWGYWSDGQGSSLELRNPDSDIRFPSNWADSNDTGESAWTAIEFSGPVGETLGTPINDRLILMLQGIGECLMDDIEVRVNNGPNLVDNGGFESGLSGWILQGSHDFSSIENEGFTGNRSLHVRAASRGDNQSNRILSPPLAQPIPADAVNVSIRAKVRWLRGHPEVLLRLHGSATEAYGRLALPRRLGTPGQPNSRLVSNLGPAVHDVTHFPVLPAANAGVVVTAQATDADGVASLTLRYRVDPSATYLAVSMVDDGTAGDAIPNDGIFSGTIPGQAAGGMVAFYVEGKDTLNASGTFPNDLFPQPGFTRCWPNDALVRECVVRWGEVQMPGDFATYHLWVSAVNSNRWHTRDTQDNASMDGTFVYNNTRVIYNALPLFSGSPWHRTNAIAGPAGTNRVDYEMNFPDDQPLLGATDFVLNNPGNPDRLTISDLSAIGEQTVYKIFEGLGLPHNHRRYIHMFVNGSQRSTAYERPGNFIFEDSQQPNGDMVGEWFPDDPGGQLFKVEDWFEFDDNGFDITANNDADLARRTIRTNGQPTFIPGLYRWMFRKRSVGVGNSANDYSGIFALIDAASPAENPTNDRVDLAALETVVDWEAWMRHFAVQRAVGNWDSYGWERGKNDYLYQTAQGFVHMPWDIDYSLGLGRPADEPLFASNDPRIMAMFNTPAIARAYWRAFTDLVTGPFNNATLDPFIDARANALTANNVNIDLTAVAAVKSFITARRAFLQGQLATVAAPFALNGPPVFSTENNLVVLTGTAPVGVKEITLNGVTYPVTWTSATGFVMRVVLESGLNGLDIGGLDRFGVVVTDATQSLSLTYTGPAAEPIGSLVISEVMYRPATGGAQFIEIVNRSAQNFNLSGWRLDGANFTFPPGSIMTNGQTVLLAQNRAAFRTAYGPVPIFALFGGALSASEQTLALIKPTVTGDLVIDGVHYEASAPWPMTALGASLQLIDLSQDNGRPSNWAVDGIALATPGAPNSVAASLEPYDPLWLNEVQIESLTGPLDNAGEIDPWLELFNSGTTPLNLGGYFLATSFTNNLTEWPVPNVTLAPGEHRLIWVDGEPDESVGTNLHTSFRLDANGRLALVRLMGGQPQITDYLKWDALAANVSYGCAPDGQSVFRKTLHAPSPGDTNAEPDLSVFINEWMAINNGTTITDPADGIRDDWFELFNGGNRTVDLGGYFLTDDEFFPMKYRIPSNGQYRLPAGGFRMVWADSQTNQNSPNQADLHVNFRLGGTFGAIRLYLPDGVTLVDSISYGAQTADISEGRFSDGASARTSMGRPTPRASNTHPTYNSRPRLPILPPQLVAPGQTITVTFRATDADAPPQLLTHALDAGPAGLQINPGGMYRWIVPTNQPLGDYAAEFHVTDNGTPPRTDNRSYIISVRPLQVIIGTPPPLVQYIGTLSGQATFTIATIPGRTYRALYKDDLSLPTWTQLDRDFVAANTSASLNDTSAAPKRFYVVVQLD